jgi:REP element-mobilizing transposase RayT
MPIVAPPAARRHRLGNRRLVEKKPASRVRLRDVKRHRTFFQLYYHFVWATRNRLPIITPQVAAMLYPFVSTKCVELEYKLHAIGGTEDHVHLLVELTPTILVADVAKMLKGASSHFVNHVSGLGDALYWQDGYGVITLRKDEAPKVANYIRNQRQHHASGTLSKLLERIETED